MSIPPNAEQHVSKHRVNRVSMPFGNDSFLTFSLNHEGLTRMVAICFDGPELFDIESVDAMMHVLFQTFVETTHRPSLEKVADAQARGEDPNLRDKILGLHLKRDENDNVYFVPAHLAHSKECGWETESTP